MNGDPNTTKRRTFFEASFTCGVPGDRWQNGAFVVDPFLWMPWSNGQIRSPKAGRNPVAKAIAWKTALDATPGLTQAQLAESEGVSRPTVAQFIRLLSLPAEILEFVRKLDSADDLKVFCERRLRTLLRASRENQFANFAQMRTQMRGKKTASGSRNRA